MTVGQSQFVKNGQQMKMTGGSAAIAQGALAIVGGPGVEAWPACTIDYAVRAPAGPIAAAAQVVGAATAGSQRQAVARDRLGNIYVAAQDGSGHLVVYKYNPVGTFSVSATLDSTATSVNSPQLHQLQNGSFVCIYARAAGALMFVIFDSQLNLIAGPSSAATERAATNVVYHASTPISGGGFAIAYQASDGLTIKLAIYSNLGSTVLAATTIQVLASTAAQEVIRLGQLSSGNLVCAFRGTMTAGGTAGISVVTVNQSGVVQSGPTNVDSTSVLGLLELSILAGGGFAIAGPNGSNLVAAVFNDAGAQQGSTYTVGNTLNTTTYPQTKLMNDGTQFWLAWVSSVANGIYVVALTTGGSATVSANALAGGTLGATTFAIDAEVVNGQLLVLAASAATAGQFLVQVGLPDASLGIVNPYLRNTAATIGSAAATTGSNSPRLIGGGGGLYRGSSPPPGQPVTPAGCGDFVAIMVYDHQNAAGTFLAIQKVEASAIVGICQTDYAANQPGQQVVINPGPGEYPTLQLGGTFGTGFNHLSSNPVGTSGALYGTGAGLAGVQQGVGVASDRVGIVEDFAGPEDQVPSNALLCTGAAVSRATYAVLFAKVGTKWGVGDGSTTFNLPDLRGAVTAGADDMGGVNAGRLGGNASTGGISDVASLGVVGGEKAHVQVIGELAAHTHTYSGASPASTQPTQGGGAAPFNGSTGSTGGGAAANVTQYTAVMNKIIYFA